MGLSCGPADCRKAALPPDPLRSRGEERAARERAAGGSWLRQAGRKTPRAGFCLGSCRRAGCPPARPRPCCFALPPDSGRRCREGPRPRGSGFQACRVHLPFEVVSSPVFPSGKEG